MSFGIGDGGGGPGEYHINMVKRCENLRYIPNVKMSSSESFFDKLKKMYQIIPNTRASFI